MATTQQPPALEELLCFDLYAASRAVTNLYRPLLNELGLTYPQWLVLVVLWGAGSCTVKDLGEQLRLDHGTLTPLLRRMEARGLVTRRRGSVDERFVQIALTPAGEALRSESARIHCAIGESLGLDESQAAALQGTLRALAAHAK
ncbi:MarR family winged helix-turn-helix transcriptional regulator [Nocardioides sp.]|uniref:MarR family winged helix-turn-helix transcriptional regulator n=1 Tax=Nocardioides sp. TaxID=35761 RepID=UPI003D115517